MPWFRRSRSPKAPLIPVVLPEPLASQVDALLERGERVEAVRLVRERTGLDLASAYGAVVNRRR
jgi:Arc/MetJ-type ribon-helix-helix transcriptional regulator